MIKKQEEWFLSWHQGDDAEDFRKLEEMMRRIDDAYHDLRDLYIDDINYQIEHIYGKKELWREYFDWDDH